MTISQISPKFQIVIPKDVRRKLNLRPGTRVSVIEKGGYIEVHPIPTPDEMIGLLKGKKPLEFEREPDREL